MKTQDYFENATKKESLSVLSSIDFLLTKSKDLSRPITDETINKLWKKLTACVYKHLNKPNGNQFEQVFRAEFNSQEKRFIAITFLRLLAYSKDIFPSNLLHLFLKFSEENLIDIYEMRQYGLSIKDQNHIKIEKLSKYVMDVEEKLCEECNLESFSYLNTFKNSFLQKLNGKTQRPLLSAFIPASILSAIKAPELFTEIEKYKEVEGLLKLKSFEKSKQIITSLKRKCKEIETNYSTIFLFQSLDSLEKALIQDFEQSPFSKPSNPEAKATGKKYPFHQKDNKFHLLIKVKNKGSGVAFNTLINITDHSGGVEFIERSINIGELQPSDNFIADFLCTTTESQTELLLEVNLVWKDYTGNSQSRNFELEFMGQRSDIDWSDLSHKEFYSTEAVETEDEFVGRSEILTSLVSRIEGNRVGSSYIYGQRRVGKSSIVKVLKSKIEKRFKDNFIVYYSETGDYKDPNPQKTLEQLGTQICQEVKGYNDKFKHLPIPEFISSFSPMVGFLNDIARIDDTCKVLIILDEFDRLPIELYSKGLISDAFFDTLRAISNKPNFGFLFVGGERMPYILRDHSQELNKFKSIKVDYFDRDFNWIDFKELITKPVKGYFDVEESVINLIYSYTAGNPFFTKVICEELFRHAVNQRDNHITEKEAQDAIKSSLKNSGEQLFAHFWLDGIRELPDKEDEVIINRRKLLLSITELIASDNLLTEDSIIENAVQIGINEDDAVKTLDEFIARGILLKKDRTISFILRFFQDWLSLYGIEKLSSSLIETDRLEQAKTAEAKARVRSQELLSLVESWPQYQGREITNENVRAWLEQFGPSVSQRLAFNILQNIRFYDNLSLRDKMKEIYRVVVKALIERQSVRSLSRDTHRKDILVSYFDGPGKSGAEYAKLFADENKIFHLNVVEPSKLSKAISEQNYKALIFIDDYIGSGRAATTFLKQLYEENPSLKSNEDLIHIAGFVTGFSSAKQKLVNTMKRQRIPLSTIHLCEPLVESDKCFAEGSNVFKNESERIRARDLCYRIGSNIVNDNPLGFGDCQSLVVFPNTIPNNDLPILWASSANWIPLFPRN